MAMTLDERIEYRRYQITKLSALLAADLAERDRLSGIRAAVTHFGPGVGGGTFLCCGRTPFEVPRSDRMTIDQELVTCRGSRPIMGVPVYVGAPAPVYSSPAERAAWDRAEEKAGEAIGVALTSGAAGDVVTVEFTDAGIEWALRMMGDADG